MSLMLALSAAGFIATSTFGESPGVRMSWSEMWTWNDDTPAMVPAGGRISAGGLGGVARALAKVGVTWGKRVASGRKPVAEARGKRRYNLSMVRGRVGSGVRIVCRFV